MNLSPSELSFRPGQVADLCGVSHSLVRRWLTQGRLKSRRLPGTLVRRVSRSALLDFLLANDFGREAEAMGWQRNVLLVGVEPEAEAVPGLRVHHARGILEAGALLVEHRPLVVTIDFGLGRGCCLAAGAYLRSCWPAVKRLALVYEDELGYAENAQHWYDAVLHHPLGAAQVLEGVGRLAGG